MKKIILMMLVVPQGVCLGIFQPTPHYVQTMYEASQKSDVDGIVAVAAWQKKYEGKKPVEVYRQAVDCAMAHNDAQSTELLTQVLAREKMGFWERNYLYIMVAALGVLGLTVFGADRVYIND